MQALKEAGLAASNLSKLETALRRLLEDLRLLKQYCTATNISYPFSRAMRQVQDGLYFFGIGVNGSSNDSDKPKFTADSISQNQGIETFELGSKACPRIFNGLWQMSSAAWDSSTAEKQEDSLFQLAKNGFVATDMADHYV